MDNLTKVIFADDDDKRHKARFQRKTEDEYLVRVWTAQECIDHLSEESWNRLELDHDFEGIYQNPEEKNTGSEVVRWIAANKPEIDEIIIHSYNHKIAPGMVESLKAAGYDAIWAPFEYTE